LYMPSYVLLLELAIFWLFRVGIILQEMPTHRFFLVFLFSLDCIQLLSVLALCLLLSKKLYLIC
jgi:hypothetical protein